MEMTYLFIGAGVVLLAAALRCKFWAFSGQKPADYADDLLVLDMKKHLNGEMVCEGVIFGPAGRVTSSFVADFNVSWDGDTAQINEHFVYDNEATQDRVWTITLGAGGRFTATAPDVPGVGRGQHSGSTIQLRYPIKLPDELGGHTLQTIDWIYLTSDGTMINRSQFRKYGIRVAELVATIRTKDR
ncbi:DUF3833 family protein [Roseobacter sp. GAI101]|uniref:DUF3833 family protein n=1 Tax=Roseobacter sp. (strain GAI101) TaxID=391589 RepID=UPI00018718A4|nr:DUF3833 family protein [Roseobacter sp. GAI101]EEB84502.1 conserved hypothetical protein [Roseobacter sp. GAI101]